MSDRGFIHLRTYSDYSFGTGSIRTNQLVKQCGVLGFPAAALTDKNNLFASLEYAIEALKYGLQPIMGIDLTILYERDLYGGVVLLASDEVGYTNLLSLASDVYLKRSQHGLLCVGFDRLLELSEGLIVLAGNPVDSVEKILFNQKNSAEIFNYLDQLRFKIENKLYLELIRHASATHVEAEFEEMILNYAYDNDIPIVATNHASFLNHDSYDAHDALSCIVGGRYILEDDRPRTHRDFYLKNAQEMGELFGDLPEALENTINIAKRCAVYAQSSAPLLPKFQTASGISEAEIIRMEAEAGLLRKMDEREYTEEERKAYKERLKFELATINRMQYAGYFLIVSDFIRWSKERGIPVGPGRGSGVGSIVAWALQITDLDPIRFGLLFERFLNPDRVSMPDFDIDFCQDRREEVIAYVTQKYGADRVAQIITFGKLQARAVLRDVGRVLHMPYGAIDRICKLVPNNPANPVTLKEAIELDKELQKSREADPEINKLLTISLELEGVNRHVSTHAAGVVIADRPIVEIVPLYKDNVASMPAVQYSMKYAEAAGLIKFDFLGLKTLTVISWTLDLLKALGVHIDILKLQLDDKLTYKLLSGGSTTGVFQFESPGMREAIKRLKPDSIEDLIALGSLYRPGPMDNIPSYINRKAGLEEPEYLHPLLEPILRETHGIIVYQEQIMEIARALAGYTLGSADLLRRAMGKKIKAEMAAQREAFVSGCVANNIPKAKAEEIFALIEKFASYGFNKSHAAAYAVISYQTAYLKAHHTKEFLIASINSEIHDTDKINLFIQEARSFGIKILPPDINKSTALFCPEGDAIRFGLGAIKNVGVAAVNKMIEVRKSLGGKFADVYDMLKHCGKGSINKRMLENLICSGALDCLGEARHRMLASVESLIKYSQRSNIEEQSMQVGLFSLAEGAIDDKPTITACDEWTHQEALMHEFGALGFYLSSHPLEPYENRLKKMGVVGSAIINSMSATGKGRKVNVAGVITSRKVKSSKRGKYALIQLSDLDGLLELSIFNEGLLYKHDALLQIGTALFITATARVEESGLRVMVDSVNTLDAAVQLIQTSLHVVIEKQDAIEAIKELFSSTGKPITLSLKLDTGEEVHFRAANGLYIQPENEQRLRKIAGVRVSEN